MNQTTSKDFRILAVALYFGGFGFVVMEGQKTIIEFGRRVADGNKNAQSLTKAKHPLNPYRPDAVVLQDVAAKGSRRWPRITTLNRQIKRVVEKPKTKVIL